MPISLIDEQENHFTLHDGNESFPVAKFGLDDTTMGQIRSLPQGYADGGKVYNSYGMPQQPSADFSAVPSNAATLFGGIDSVKLEDVGPAIDPYQGINFLRPDQQTTLGANFPRADAAASTGLGLMGPTTTYEAPAMQVPGATPAQTGLPGYLSQTQQFMQPQQQAQAGLPGDYTKAFDEIQQGTLQQAQASADAAAQQAQVYEQQMKELQLNEIARKAKADAVMNDINKIQNDVMTQKIDPTRVWSNMSTGNRVLAGISIFLGGVAGGMQGTENRALGIIQDAVNKDIDAQKADMGKKQNMLSLNMAKYNNINDAAAATKAQLLSITQAQINQSAAKMGSKQALAAAQVANGQIDLQKAQLVSQISTSQAAAEKLNNPAGISPKDVLKLNQDIQDKLVQMPNGNYLPAFNKERASKVAELQTKMYPIKSLINEANAFMDQGGTLPLSDRNAEANRLEKNILIELKNLKELGQLTEGDMGIINPLLPSLGDFFQKGKSRDALSSINRQIEAKLNASYSANIPGLNPSGRQSRETSVFGK
jgi:hypothetical protein